MSKIVVIDGVEYVPKNLSEGMPNLSEEQIRNVRATLDQLLSELGIQEQLHLYVWRDFSSHVTSGLALAIADSEKQAQEMVIRKCGDSGIFWGDLATFSLTSPIACLVNY